VGGIYNYCADKFIFSLFALLLFYYTSAVDCICDDFVIHKGMPEAKR